MSDPRVMGVGMIKFGRYPDRTVADMGAEAALLALDDAGLTLKDVQDIPPEEIADKIEEYGLASCGHCPIIEDDGGCIPGIPTCKDGICATY